MKKLIVLLLCALAGCTTTVTGPTGQPVQAPWSPQQTAYVELVTYNIAQHVAVAIASAPTITPKAVLEIQTGEAASVQGVLAQAVVLTAGGSVGMQAFTAASQAISTATNNLSNILTAEHGATAPNGSDLAIAGGVAALANAPLVLTAIEQVKGGWVPSQQDMTNIVQSIQQADQVMQAIKVTK